MTNEESKAVLLPDWMRECLNTPNVGDERRR